MAYDKLNVTVEVRTAWWLRYYVSTLVFFCRLFGTEPDYVKVERVIRRATTAKVKAGW